MKCGDCQDEIRRGLEERKRVEIYTQPDGSEKAFGINMPDGLLSAATGTLRRAEHQKCWWAHKNKETRAATVLARKQEERRADPGHHERAEQDWRDPMTVEIGDLGEGVGTA